jgi:hypothetical protein
MRTAHLARLAAIVGALYGATASANAQLSPTPTSPAAKAPLFIILSPKAFHAELADYAVERRNQLPTELVALEDVLAKSTGADDPEKLKRFLYAAWRERGLRYVLLVGDADVMPVRYMVLDRCTKEAFDYAFYPSDLYYGDAAKPDGSFEDWNGRKDDFHAGYFGEVRGEKNKSDAINFDAIDYRPELAVGRWPVNTENEVRTLVQKTRAYERYAEQSGRFDPAGTNGDAPGIVGTARRAVMVAIGGWVESRPGMDAIAAKLPAGWNVEKRYWADANRDDKTPPPSEAEVVKLMNEGVGLVFHTGHGQDHAWEHGISVGSIQKLKNANRLPILMSAGCSTARFATLPPYEAYVDVDGREHKGTNAGQVFDKPPPPPACYQKGACNQTGLGEQLLRAGPNGAVAYIGCNTGSQPCGMTLQDGFVETLAKLSKSGPSPRLGDVWAGAVAFYYEKERLAELKPNDDWYPPSIFFQGMKFMLFGDPTLRMPGRS